jgi:phosphoglycolate phosphatase
MSKVFNDKILSYTEKFDHIIWDWNGTLMNDIEIAVDALNTMLIENNLKAINIPTYKEVFGFPIRKYYEKVGFDLEKISFEKLCDRFVQEYNHTRAKTADLFHGVPDLLSEIKKTKTQSILSAAEQNHLHEMTDHFNLSHHFHHRFGISDFFANSKTARGHELITHSGISADRTILIGDTDHDFEVADAMGVSCLLVADGHQSEHRLRALTDHVITR